jgi:hypothetical protein
MGGMTLHFRDSYIILSLVNANGGTNWHFNPIRNKGLFKDARRGINEYKIICSFTRCMIIRLCNRISTIIILSAQMFTVLLRLRSQNMFVT